MGSPTVDYDALASQHGGSATVDYDSLAAKHGAVPDATKAGGFLDAVSRFGQGFYDKTLKGAVDTLGAAGNAIMHPKDTATAIANSPIVQHPVDTAVAAAKNAYQTHASMLQQAKESFQSGNYDDAIQRGTNALIPILGPQIQSSVDKANGGDLAGGLGELVGTLGTVLAAAPGVSEAVASKAADLADAIGVAKPVQGAATRLYQSALKPSMRDPKEAAAAVEAGLNEGIPITPGGQRKLASQLQDLAQKTKAVIASDPTATIDPNAVAGRLDATRARFANQVNPVSDVNTIDQAKQEFLNTAGAKPGRPAVPPQPTGVLDATGKPVMTAGSPAVPPTPAPPMSAADAQAIKQGTYQQLAGKYGELKSAQIEAEKTLARGIKEELNEQFPELKNLNAKQEQLYGLLPFLERAVSSIGNHNILSLGDVATGAATAAAGHGLLSVPAMVMRQTLGSPMVKSKLAIMLNAAARSGGAVESPAASMARVNSYLQSLDSALSPYPQALPMAASNDQAQMASR